MWYYLKAVDFIPSPTYQDVQMLLKRTEIVTPLTINRFILLQAYPGEESRLDVTVKPFELSV